jgi:O-antigen/teichoic acid export membrane protein
MLRHVLIYAPARFIPAAIALLNLAVFTRILTVEDYGYFALATSAALILDGFLGQWLMAGIMRFHAEQTDERHVDRLLASCGVLFLLPGVFVCLAALGLSAFWRPAAAEYQALLLAVPYFLIYSFEQLVLRVHMARLASARFTMLHLIQSAASASLAIGLTLWISPDPAYALIGMMSGFLAVLAIDWRTTRRFLALARASRPIMREILRFAWPTILSSGPAFLTARLNRFFVLALLGPASVGVLNAAQALTEQALAAVFMTIAMAAQPMTVKAQLEMSAAALERRLRANAIWVFAIGLPSAAGFALLAPELATLFLGEAYRAQATAIMPWIALAAFLNGYRSHFLLHSFFLARKVHYNLYIAGPALLLTLAANAALIPLFGLSGAVAALLLVETASTILAFALTRRAIPMPTPLAEIARIGLATAVMAAAMIVVALPSPLAALLAKTAVGGLAFALAGLMLNIEQCREKAVTLFRRLIAGQSLSLQ